jgi:putative ABC transport system permease protein
MFLRLAYLWHNLTRNLLRTFMTGCAVALPIVIFVLSTSVIDAFQWFLDNSTKQLRLAVTHKSSIVNPLPSAYRARIEALDKTGDEIISVCGLNWIGGKIEGETLPLSTLAVDTDTFTITFPEYNLDEETLAQWRRNRQAIIVGESTAKQMGWKVGQHITITQSLPPFAEIEFFVICTDPNAIDKVTNFCRRDYLNEQMRKYVQAAGGEENVSVTLETDTVMMFYVKCQNQAALTKYRGVIDETFANTPDATRTQDEKSFMNEFITQQFDLPRNLTILSSITVLVAIMAAANTMSMNFRDRLREFASLKAIGFAPGYSITMILFESVAICVIGGAFGALIPYALFNWTPVGEITIPVIQSLVVPRSACVQALVISVGIGLVAGLWPALLAARLNVIEALRSLE